MFAAVPLTAAAQTPLEDGPMLVPGDAFAGQAENDVFDYFERGRDRYYTHGTHASFLLASEPPPWAYWVKNKTWLLNKGEGEPFRWGWVAGQNIYTPEEILLDDPDPQDRPYTGYAYGGVALISSTDKELNTLELRAGLVGPSAQSDFAQDEVHDLIETARASGWDYQLEDELAGSIVAERRWAPNDLLVFGGARMAPVSFSWSDYVGAELGTVRTGAEAGIGVRLQWGRDRDYGFSRSWPAPMWSTLTRPSDSLLNGYVFANIEARGVLRDITLDGNTFQDSARVEKRYFVPESQIGAVVRIAVFRIGFTQVYRAHEFEGQNGPHEFGRWNVSLVRWRR